ncbi:MAG: HD domain-containing protein [Actinomycetota bacterium]
MTAPEIELNRVWRHLFDAPDQVPIDATLEALMERHREPGRSYHTATHVLWVLRHVDTLLDSVPDGEPCDAGAVRAAALFHDAVYDPRSATNELDSARLATDVLEEFGWEPSRIRRVATLIEATAGHLGSAPKGDGTDASTGATGTGTEAIGIGVTGDPNAVSPWELAILLDADLAALGADPAEYAAYARGVRSEYAHIDDADWRSGRSAVLQHFLAMPFIYRTAVMREQRERRARANLAAELASLATVSSNGAPAS